MINEIGLVIWGCKGGYRMFCDNRVVDVEDKVIRQTLKDIRSFIFVKQAGLDYYAVEFTPKYKVFTHYRSSNDSGSGAFIAITIFVPHNRRIRNVRAILDEMMVEYFREYMNPMSNTALPGKYDDINKFQKILSDHTDSITSDTRRLKWLPSTQDDRPQIMKYDDIALVDKYFDNPYHKEFFGCQEVMFLRSEYYDRHADFDIEFMIEPGLISKVSESEMMSRLLPVDVAKKNMAVTRLKVNGEDFMSDPEACVVDQADTLEVTLERPRFKPYDINGLTLRDLLASGIIVKRGEDFEFGNIPFVPEKYVLKVEAAESSLPLTDFALRLYLACGGSHKRLMPIENGGYGFEFSGPEVDQESQLLYFPAEKESFSLGYLKPDQLISAGKALTLAAEKFEGKIKFADGEIQAVDANVSMPGDDGKEKSITIPYTGNKPIILPIAGDRHCSVNLSLADYKVEQEGDVWTFTPEFVKVNLFIPKPVRPYFEKYSLKVALGDQTFNVKDSGNGNGIVKLPFGWEKIDEKPRLVVTKKDKESIISLFVGDNGALCFHCVVVESKCKSPVKAMLGDSVREIEKHLLIFEDPTAPFIVKDADKYNVVSDITKLCAFYTISPKAATLAVTEKEQKKDREEKPKKTDEPKLPFGDDAEIKFVNCGKFKALMQFKGDKEPSYQLIAKDEQVVKVRYKEYKLRTEKDIEVLSINLNDRRKTYRSGDFVVQRVSEDKWIVTYKPTFISKFVDFFCSKIGLGLIALLILSGAGVWSYFTFFAGSAERTYAVTLQSDERIKAINVIDPGKVEIRASGNTFTIINKGDSVNFTGNEVLAIDFDTEGIDTLAVNRLLESNDIARIKLAFNPKEKGQDNQSLTVAMKNVSPASRLFSSVIIAPDSVNVADFKSKFSRSTRVAELDKALAEIAENAKKEQENKDRIEGIKAEYKKLIARLGSMDAKKADLDKVVDYQKEHKDEIAAEIAANRVKINAYSKFFDPGANFSTLVKHFSKSQQEACSYYLKIKKNDPKRDFNYAKDKAKEMGLL